MDEKSIEQLFQCDLSAGTEAFREKLLERCLNVLNDDDEGIPLDDEELDLIAAAGNPFANPALDDTLGIP